VSCTAAGMQPNDTNRGGGSQESKNRKSEPKTQQEADRSGGSGQKQIGGDVESDRNPRDSADRDSTQH
jgi:hypothetical protein